MKVRVAVAMGRVVVAKATAAAARAVAKAMGVGAKVRVVVAKVKVAMAAAAVWLGGRLELSVGRMVPARMAVAVREMGMGILAALVVALRVATMAVVAEEGAPEVDGTVEPRVVMTVAVLAKVGHPARLQVWRRASFDHSRLRCPGPSGRTDTGFGTVGAERRVRSSLGREQGMKVGRGRVAVGGPHLPIDQISRP